MDLTALDDIITRLNTLRLTAQVVGLPDYVLGRLFTDDLPRLERLRADLASRLIDGERERDRLETALGQKL